MSWRDKKYDGLLGMTEMECAVEVMEKLSIEQNIPISQVRVVPGQFFGKQGMHESSLIGFCQLLARGLMETDYPNGIFIMSKSLINILNKAWGLDLPPPKTYLEIFEENIKLLEK